jgi:hypothetical protein
VHSPYHKSNENTLTICKGRPPNEIFARHKPLQPIKPRSSVTSLHETTQQSQANLDNTNHLTITSLHKPSQAMSANMNSLNSPSGGGNGSGSNNNDRPRLTDAEKKQNHILSEQKRRQAIRQGFDRLAAMTPGMVRD